MEPIVAFGGNAQPGDRRRLTAQPGRRPPIDSKPLDPRRAARFALAIFLVLLWSGCVQRAAPGVTSVAIDQGDTPLVVGETLELTATVVTSGGASAAVTWESSHPLVAELDASVDPVVVTALAVGATTITATSTVDPSKSDAVTLIVSAAPPAPSVVSVIVDQEDADLVIGEELQLSVTVLVTGGAAMTVDWSSSEVGVASVGATGLVTAVGSGEAEIMATSTFDPNKSDAITLTVTAPTPAVRRVTIPEGSQRLLVGQTVQLNAEVDAVGGADASVTWSSSDAEKVGVDDVGLVTALAATHDGVTITATSDFDPTQAAGVTVQVFPEAAILGVSIDQGDLELQIGDEKQLTATVEYAGMMSDVVTWSSSAPGLVSVNYTTGLLTALAEGEATITATSFDDTNVSGTITATVVVPPAILGVSIPDGDQTLLVDATFTFSKVVQSQGGASEAVTWSSGNVRVAIVDPVGIVTALDPGVATITATSDFDPTKSASVKVTVDVEADGLDGFACGALDAATIGTTGIGTADPSNQVLVAYRHDPLVTAAEADAAASRALAIVRDAGGRLLRRGAGTEHDLFEVPLERLAQALADLAALPEVAHAVRNYALWPRSAPNDPYYVSHQWNLRDFGAEAAWTVADALTTPPTPPIIVAVIDDGVAFAHRELRDSLLPGWDVVDGDDDPRNCTDHGTQVAGIVVAARDNLRGIAGIASVDWVRVVPVKVAANAVEPTSVSIDALLRGMRWAVGLPITDAPENPHPADVVNVSLGISASILSEEGKKLFADVVAAVEGTGAIVVAAAGNDGDDQFGVDYPARVASVAVGSVDVNFTRDGFSNYGEGLALSAPGGAGSLECEGVFTTGLRFVDDDARTKVEHQVVCSMGRGTSMATAYVSGATALLLGLEPALRGDPEAIATRLVTAAGRRPAGLASEYGAGVLCLDALLDPEGTGVCAPP